MPAKTTPPLLIFGASGHARVVIDAARRSGRFELVGLIDGGVEAGTTVEGVAVLGDDSLVGLVQANHPGLRCVIGIGSNVVRTRLATSLAAHRPVITFVPVVHPSAVVADSAVIGPGAFVAAGAIINPGVRVGAHAIVNTGATVDHEAVIDDFASIGPNSALAGKVSVGRGAAIGIAAAAIPGVAIGAQATVGAGAVVIRDIAPGETVAGVPARPIRRTRAGFADPPS